MPGFLQILGLLHEKVWRKYDTVAYYVHLAALEYARRYASQNVFLTLKLKGMACIRTALKACHDIIFRRKHINNLALAFIAPLQTEQDINFAFFHIRSNVYSCYLCFLFSFDASTLPGMCCTFHICIMKNFLF